MPWVSPGCNRIFFPSISYCSSLIISDFLWRSDNFKRGIDLRSSSESSLVCLSFSNCVETIHSSILSLEKSALILSSFLDFSSDLVWERPFTGFNVTVIRWVLFKKYFCIRSSKYPLSEKKLKIREIFMTINLLNRIQWYQKNKEKYLVR